MLFLSSIKSAKTLEIRGIMYGRINKIVYCLDTLQVKGLIKPPNKFVSVSKCKGEIIEKCKNLGIKVNYEPIKKMSYVDKLKDHLKISKINHDEEIMKQPTLKSAHIYCVINNVSAQQYGPLLEKYIINYYKYNKKKSTECIGDCSDKDLNNIEIKVSIGGSNHDKFNYVQIRISQNVSYYILTAYHLSSMNVENEGELYMFKVSKEDLKQIILEHGSYAHGTIKKNGKITIESLNDETNLNEYAIRPLYGDECWNSLMKFRIN